MLACPRDRPTGQRSIRVDPACRPSLVSICCWLAILRVIKPLPLILVSVLALQVSSASAADAGIYTIVDGDVRVLRGTTWYRLAPGARVQDGDIVDAGGLAQLQLELTDGGRQSVPPRRMSSTNNASLSVWVMSKLIDAA